MSGYLVFWVTAVVAWSVLLQKTLAHHECSCDRQRDLENQVNTLTVTNIELRNYVKLYCPVTTTTTTRRTTTPTTTTPTTTTPTTTTPTTTTPIPTTPIPTTPPTACRYGYVKLTDDYCYKVITEKLSWSEGQARCARDNPDSHLAYVENSDQNDAIVQYLLGCKDQDVCKVHGGNDQSFSTCGQRTNPNECGDYNEFRWTNAKPKHQNLKYKNWKRGEPTCPDSYHPQGCLQYRCEKEHHHDYSCSWYGYPCSTKICPLCQYKLNS